MPMLLTHAKRSALIVSTIHYLYRSGQSQKTRFQFKKKLSRCFQDVLARDRAQISNVWNYIRTNFEQLSFVLKRNVEL